MCSILHDDFMELTYLLHIFFVSDLTVGLYLFRYPLCSIAK